MPYHIEKATDGFVVKDNKGKSYGKHKTRAKAQAQIRAIYANTKEK